MINKQDLADMIENELYIQFSNLLEYKLEGESFFIVDSWSSIKRLMSLQGINDDDNRVCYRCKQTIGVCQCDKSSPPYYEKQNTLDLDKLFGLYNSNWVYPLDEYDLSKIQHMINTLDSLNHGQLILDESMNPAKSIDEWITDNHSSIDILSSIVNYASENPGDSLDDINEWIKDQIDGIEWGFSDEYTICSECGINSFRTSPDSYSWKRSYLDSEYGYICKPCALSQGYMDDFIAECQTDILNGNSPKSFPDNIFDLDESEWHKIIHPLSYGQWENGLHHGQKDNPTKQGRFIKAIQFKGFRYTVFDIVFLIYPEQFTVSWDSYIRLNPEFVDEYQDRKHKDFIIASWDRLLTNLGDKLYHNTQDKYSPGELYSKALRENISTRYNKISVNTDTGDIQIDGTNNLDEYLNNQ